MLLIAVAMLALPLGYVGWKAKIVREREAFLENRYYLPGESSPFEPVQAPWLLRLLGVKGASRAFQPLPASAIAGCKADHSWRIDGFAKNRGSS